MASQIEPETVDTKTAPPPAILEDAEEGALFRINEVSEITGVSKATINRWLGAGHMATIPESRGSKRHWTWRQVAEIAVARVLIDSGLPPQIGCRIAAIVCHTGSEKRLPALPYMSADGSPQPTILVWNGERLHICDGWASCADVPPTKSAMRAVDYAEVFAWVAPHFEQKFGLANAKSAE